MEPTRPPAPDSREAARPAGLGTGGSCTVKVDIPPAGHATGTNGTTIAVWDATIWHRDPAGRWRIAVDISTPLPPGRR